MALEIEAKLRVEALDPVRHRLQSLGAAPLGVVLETNEIFDRDDGSLRAMGCGLRIRSTLEDGTGRQAATLTFKGPIALGKFKTREEQEVEVSDAAATSRILRGLGFIRMLWYQKRRESWTLDECRVELDEPPHIGLFVEIEGPGETAIAAVRDKLGLQTAIHETASYVRMLYAYCKEQGVTSHELPLSEYDAPAT